MNVLIFGGTGLLGSAAAQIFIDRGHKVKTIALPPLPEGAPIPKEMDIEFGNFLELTDEELEKAMTGMDAFVYAAGVDERVEFPHPVYDAYKKYNINPTDRFLKMAKKCGVKRCVVLGSYFAWLAKERPDMQSFAISTLISVPVLSRKRLLLNMLMMIWVLQFLNFRISSVLSRADALFGLSLLNSFKDLKKCLSLCIQREALQCLQFARLVKLL